jgi:hypothetical protein
MHRTTLILCLSTCVGGCSSAPPPRTARMTEIGVEQTNAQVRVLLHEYLRWFTAETVIAGDGVIEAETELAVQEAALRLKVNAVTSMQAALFQRDPIAALADAWALTAGIARFFDQGNGRDLFGGSQSLVVDAFHGLEAEIDRLVQSIVGKERADAVRPEIEQFVRDNPLRDLSFGRRSAGLRASSVTAAEWQADGLRSVAQIDETARDLSDRMTIYAEQLPQIVRWQGEILLIESQHKFVAKPFANLDGVDRNLIAIEKDVDAAARFLTSTPELLAAERALLLDALRSERATILASIDEQRVATLAAVTAEREAILEAVEELRRTSFEDLGTETEESLGRVEKLSTATVEELRRASREAVDHLFWRAVQLLLIGSAAFAVLSLALRRTRPRVSS